MSYNKTKIAVYDVRKGYNRAAKIYKSFHAGLASYDKGLFQRFLPRVLENTTILDIGSADARLFSHFADKRIARYIGFDCADDLLKRAPSRVEKVIGDIENIRPFDDHSIDIGLCFFVLLHIHDIHHVFSEAKRVIRPGGCLIVLHNVQRRSYIYEFPGETYKIEDHHRSNRDIEDAAHDTGRTVDSIPLEEKGTLIGTLYRLS